MNHAPVEQPQGPAALADWAQRIIRTHIDAAGDALAAHCKKPRSRKRLHEARKQLARLRAALDDLAPLAGVGPEFRERVREIHRRAGRVRDADILRARVDEYAEDAFGRECEELAALDTTLKKRRRKGRRKLAAVIAQTAPGLRT